MKKIAVEEHVHTQGYLRYLRSRKTWPKREPFPGEETTFEREEWAPGKFRKMPIGAPTLLEEVDAERLKNMDAAGIDMQILSLAFPSVEFFDGKDAARVAAVVNDELAEMVGRHPKRYAALAAIAPQDPESAARELERAVTQLGFKGAMITGSVQDEYIDKKKYWPIFAKAEELDVPIYIHPKMPPTNMIEQYLEYPGLTQAMLGFAADASLHAMRLILSGVFDQYPRVKVILGHLGEALPFWLWRMDSRLREVKKSEREAAEYYKDFKKTPSQYFKDNFYVTTSGMFWAPVLEFVSRVFGADRIMYASDYPFELGEDITSFIDESALSQEDKEKIYHLNAERLFKL
jgi:2,3-dihydroxybenzoate decarboxylase